MEKVSVNKNANGTEPDGAMIRFCFLGVLTGCKFVE